MANDIIVPQQSGFRTQHSTKTSLLKSTNDWLINMDKGLINGILFFDLKTAFDTVNHEVLVSKLQIYGVQDTAIRLFQSYFR